MSIGVRIRRALRPGDLEAIVAHHDRVYRGEYGVDSRFVDQVAATVARAALAGFPGEREAIRIVEHNGGHAGSIALTGENDDVAALRWVVLDRELRGHGIGRQLLDDVLAVARQSDYALVFLDTFSELEAAGRMYRERGFRVVSEDAGPRWGRDHIVYQHYELELRSAAPRGRIPEAVQLQR